MERIGRQILERVKRIGECLRDERESLATDALPTGQTQ